MGWWRSVGHSYNAWFVEHAFDIAARASGRDPVALRLAMLANRPRHAAVLRADQKLWPQPPAAGRFRGTALHESFGSIVAQSVEISMQGDRPVLHRATCAIDCGMALDPDTTRAQMEGGMIFGLSAALYGEITVRNGRVQQQNFDQYRLLSLRDTPEIDVTIVDSGADLGGVGEAGVPPIAPALCNAILAATDRPTFRLPIHRRNG
jgi:isoquinoline 1-oxidoreductase beta subunit